MAEIRRLRRDVEAARKLQSQASKETERAWATVAKLRAAHCRPEAQASRTPEDWAADDSYAETAKSLLIELSSRDNEEAQRILADVLRQATRRRRSEAKIVEAARKLIGRAHVVGREAGFRSWVDTDALVDLREALGFETRRPEVRPVDEIRDLAGKLVDALWDTPLHGTPKHYVLRLAGALGKKTSEGRRAPVVTNDEAIGGAQPFGVDAADEPLTPSRQPGASGEAGTIHDAWAELKTVLATEIPNTHKTKRFYEAWNDVEVALDALRRAAPQPDLRAGVEALLRKLRGLPSSDLSLDIMDDLKELLEGDA